jgi:hypothetical protein
MRSFLQSNPFTFMIFQAVRLASRCEPGGSRANRLNDTPSFCGIFHRAERFLLPARWFAFSVGAKSEPRIIYVFRR